MFVAVAEGLAMIVAAAHSLVAPLAVAHVALEHFARYRASMMEVRSCPATKRRQIQADLQDHCLLDLYKLLAVVQEA